MQYFNRRLSIIELLTNVGRELEFAAGQRKPGGVWLAGLEFCFQEEPGSGKASPRTCLPAQSIHAHCLRQ